MEMIKDPETMDYFNTNYEKTIAELSDLDKKNELRIEINQGLEEALQELQSLKDAYSAEDGATLLELCKNTVIETITSQFGLASVFIECKDGGNVTTIHNAKKDIYAREEDQYNREDYTGSSYVKASSQYKDGKIIENTAMIQDEYTGDYLDYSEVDCDHIKPLKVYHQEGGYMQPKDKKEAFGSDPENFAMTSSGGNRSLGADDKKEWQEKSATDGSGNINKTRFNHDNRRVNAAVERGNQAASKHAPSNIDKGMYYGKQAVLTGGKDAAHMAAYSAIGTILREVVQELFIELKNTFNNFGNESLKEIFQRFKKRLSEIYAKIKENWKDILSGSIETGLTAFFSNLLVFVINLFATTLKKIVTMIRAGFVSLVQALKLLTNPPEGMPPDEIHYAAFKILVAGLIGAASLGLSAAIEKFLQSIPGLQPLMMFPIPLLGKTVSDVIAVTLSALAGGIVTTVALYFMDKCRSQAKKSKLQIQLIAQSGLVVEYQIAQTWFVLDDGYRILKDAAIDAVNTVDQTHREFKRMQPETQKSVDSFLAVVERAKSKFNKNN